MKPLRIFALAGGVIFLLCLLAVAVRSGNDYSDGEQALAKVRHLNKGMSMSDAISTLHPERTKSASQMSYSLHPNAKSQGEMLHALTHDRHLVMTFDSPKPGSRTSDPKLGTWELREGNAQREDVTIGRALDVGGFRIRY